MSSMTTHIIVGLLLRCSNRCAYKIPFSCHDGKEKSFVILRFWPGPIDLRDLMPERLERIL
jgi:hypothetical protein